MEDTYKHKGLRRKLASEIRRKGIENEEVIRAVETVPRHFFMESGFVKFAYKDQAFPIGNDQTISQPYTVAFQTELLDPKKHEKVLEIGTGSGYQAAILLEMGVKLYSIERYRELYLKAKSLLNKMGYQPYLFYGDGYKGKPTYAPYDKILVTAGAAEIPQALVDQLKVGGKMVIPLGGMSGQEMMLVEKISETEIRKTSHGSFIFVPLVEGKDTNNKNE